MKTPDRKEVEPRVSLLNKINHRHAGLVAPLAYFPIGNRETERSLHFASFFSRTCLFARFQHCRSECVKCNRSKVAHKRVENRLWGIDRHRNPILE